MVEHVCPEKDIVCGTHPGRWCKFCPKLESPEYAFQKIENLVAKQGDENSPAALQAFALIRQVIGLAAAPPVDAQPVAYIRKDQVQQALRSGPFLCRVHPNHDDGFGLVPFYFDAPPASDPVDASNAGDPTYTDDLELRYAEVCEERDHLRRALAQPAAPVAKFDMATFQTLMAAYGEAQFMYGEWSADCEDSGQRLCDDVIAKRTALLNYLRQFARRDGEAG